MSSLSGSCRFPKTGLDGAQSLVKYGGKHKHATSKWGLYSYVSEGDIRWPDIPYGPWRSTCSALHLYIQIIGKYRLARSPWVNHSWHALAVHDRPSARWTGQDRIEPRSNQPMRWSDEQPMDALPGSRLSRCRSPTFMGVGSHSYSRWDAGVPWLAERDSEAIPFAEDRMERPYDANAVTQFFRACVGQ